MTNYKIENHDLMNTMVNMRKGISDNSPFDHWAYETTMGRDQKIKAVDELWQLAGLPCSMSELLMTMDRYKADIANNTIKHKVIEHSWSHNPEIKMNTNSYIAWVHKQNKMANKQVLSDSTGLDGLGSIRGFGFRLYIWSEKVPGTEYGYNEKYTGGDIVDQVFYEMLEKLYLKELKHFKETDSKQVDLATVKKYISEQKYPCFSDRIWNACMNGKDAMVTKQELEIALNAYKALDEYVTKLEETTKAQLKTCHIK